MQDANRNTIRFMHSRTSQVVPRIGRPSKPPRPTLSADQGFMDSPASRALRQPTEWPLRASSRQPSSRRDVRFQGCREEAWPSDLGRKLPRRYPGALSALSRGARCAGKRTGGFRSEPDFRPSVKKVRFGSVPAVPSVDRHKLPVARGRAARQEPCVRGHNTAPLTAPPQHPRPPRSTQETAPSPERTAPE